MQSVRSLFFTRANPWPLPSSTNKNIRLKLSIPRRLTMFYKTHTRFTSPRLITPGVPIDSATPKSQAVDKWITLRSALSFPLTHRLYDDVPGPLRTFLFGPLEDISILG